MNCFKTHSKFAIRFLIVVAFNHCAREEHDGRHKYSENIAVQNSSENQTADNNVVVNDPLADGLALNLITDQVMILNAYEPQAVDMTSLRIKNPVLYRLLKEHMQRWYLLTAHDASVDTFVEAFGWLVGSIDALSAPINECKMPDGLLEWSAKSQQPGYFICRNPVVSLPAGCQISPFCNIDQKACLIGCGAPSTSPFPVVEEAESALNLGPIAAPRGPGRIPTIDTGCRKFGPIRPVLGTGNSPLFEKDMRSMLCAPKDVALCNPRSCRRVDGELSCSDVLDAGEKQLFQVNPKSYCYGPIQQSPDGITIAMPGVCVPPIPCPPDGNTEVTGPKFTKVELDPNKPILLQQMSPKTTSISQQVTSKRAERVGQNGNSETASSSATGSSGGGPSGSSSTSSNNTAGSGTTSQPSGGGAGASTSINPNGNGPAGVTSSTAGSSSNAAATGSMNSAASSTGSGSSSATGLAAASTSGSTSQSTTGTSNVTTGPSTGSGTSGATAAAVSGSTGQMTTGVVTNSTTGPSTGSVTGPTGASGASATTGQTGASGLSGAPGTSGSIGPTGPTGP